MSGALVVRAPRPLRFGVPVHIAVHYFGQIHGPTVGTHEVVERLRGFDPPHQANWVPVPRPSSHARDAFAQAGCSPKDRK